MRNCREITATRADLDTLFDYHFRRVNLIFDSSDRIFDNLNLKQKEELKKIAEKILGHRLLIAEIFGKYNSCVLCKEKCCNNPWLLKFSISTALVMRLCGQSEKLKEALNNNKKYFIENCLKKEVKYYSDREEASRLYEISLRGIPCVAQGPGGCAYEQWRRMLCLRCICPALRSEMSENDIAQVRLSAGKMGECAEEIRNYVYKIGIQIDTALFDE